MLNKNDLRTDNTFVGNYVWGCRLNVDDFLYTKTKTLEPTKMMIRKNKHYVGNTAFYNASYNHAVGISKTGKILNSRIFGLADMNLYLFNTKIECINFFKVKSLELIKDINLKKQYDIDFYNEKIKKLHEYQNIN